MITAEVQVRGAKPCMITDGFWLSTTLAVIMHGLDVVDDGWSSHLGASDP
jgi:hypothetical protein